MTFQTNNGFMLEFAERTKLALFILKKISTLSRMSEEARVSFTTFIFTKFVFMSSETILSKFTKTKLVISADISVHHFLREPFTSKD